MERDRMIKEDKELKERTEDLKLRKREEHLQLAKIHREQILERNERRSMEKKLQDEATLNSIPNPIDALRQFDLNKCMKILSLNKSTVS
jgi:hypothetical protein